MEEVRHVPVVVVGGGVAGLVAAATMSRLGLETVVLERRETPQEADKGADLALWPGAVALLRALGVDDDFFELESYALHTVLMCNMHFDDGSEGAPTADVLTTVDMRAVTEGTGENFALVPRDALMARLRALVPEGVVRYGACVKSVGSDGAVEVHYGDDGKVERLQAQIVVGCDGARSCTRAAVEPDAPSPQFAGETVYRGVLQGEQLTPVLRALLPDVPDARTMRICYGAGLRSSFGFMRADGAAAYWWVKQPAAVDEEKPADEDGVVAAWPAPLRHLRDATPDDARYAHRVERAAPLKHWHSGRVVLAGDAAHLVTPNMGQGACLAAEDAFVLAVLLARHWKDDHAEAFRAYEDVRRPFAQQCADEARKQLFIGQLAWRPFVWLRNFALRNVPPSVLQRKLTANNFDVKPYLDEFSTLCVV